MLESRTKKVDEFRMGQLPDVERIRLVNDCVVLVALRRRENGNPSRVEDTRDPG